jgi:hypothetical protein
VAPSVPQVASVSFMHWPPWQQPARHETTLQLPPPDDPEEELPLEDPDELPLVEPDELPLEDPDELPLEDPDDEGPEQAPVWQL